MQGGSSGIGYGLKYQARCISDVKADTDHTSFITGTLSLKEENEVHLIRLSSDGTELVCEGLFSHPNEIWDLASCPFDQRIFSTVYSTGESYGAAIWQIPELYGELNSPQLERITSLDSQVGKIKCILWWPSGRHDKLISIDEENLSLWSLDLSKKAAQVQTQESAGVMHYLSGGAWDPHDMNAVAATCESSIQFWDLRTMKKTNSIEHAHVRNVDYNPKKKHVLITAEDESGIRIWDLRKPKVPIQELPGHTHWTWAVWYNPEYDGLILVCALSLPPHPTPPPQTHTRFYMFWSIEHFLIKVFYCRVLAQTQLSTCGLLLHLAMTSLGAWLTHLLGGLIHCSTLTVIMKTVFMALLGALVSLGSSHHYPMMEG